MEEMNFDSDQKSESVPQILADVRQQLAEQGKQLAAQGHALAEMRELVQKAAPLLESRAARIALGAQRHPILNALAGGKSNGR